MNRLVQTFSSLKQNGKKAFVPYIMGGDGGLDTLSEKLILLEKFGATFIEVGVPFSDPVADGPTIQQAGIRALKSGTTLKGIIEELTRVKSKVTIPLVLMTYLNPIYAYGMEAFVHDISAAGVDGCIIPDLPIEEEDLIAPILKNAEIELIRLVTPTTSQERIRQISKKGNGFLYAVTIKGTTGTRNEFDQGLNEFLKSISEVSPIPVLAGFGISNTEQIKKITQDCDGVVVGSKVVDLFSNHQLTELEQLMAGFKEIEKINTGNV